MIFKSQKEQTYLYYLNNGLTHLSVHRHCVCEFIWGSVEFSPETLESII